MIHGEHSLSGDAVHAAVGHHGPQQLVFLLVGGHQVVSGDGGQHRPDAPAPPVGHAGGEGEIRAGVGADQVAVADTLLDHGAEAAHAQLVSAVSDADGDGILVIEQQVGVRQQLVDVVPAEVVEMAVLAAAGPLDGDDMGGSAVLQQPVAKGLGAVFWHAQHLGRGGIQAAGGQHGGAGGLVGDDGDPLADLLQHGGQVGCAHGAVGLALAPGELHRKAGNNKHLTGLQQRKAQCPEISPGQVRGQAAVAGVGLHHLPDA